MYDRSDATSSPVAAANPGEPGADHPRGGLRSLRRRRLILHSLAGGACGYLVVHPIAMSIFRWLGHGEATAVHTGGIPDGLLQALADSFDAHMLPMGLLFGVLCAAVGAMDGYLRAALAHQRDDLSAQLAINVAYRRNLEQMLAQVRELELANRRATRFMVHDFKNHLACVIGFAGILRARAGGSFDAAARDAVERIHRQALRMLGAVTDLLDLARLDARPELNRQAFEVPALLAEVAGDLSLPARQGGVEIGAGAASCPTVLGDARLLNRVLVNLAANAFKHNPPGTTVVLDAQVSPQGAATVTFSCSDNGVGISVEEMSGVFDEFKTTDLSGASSGLGLAFCKTAVEAHGGRIWCESAPNGGTAFYFTIACTAPPAPGGLAPSADL